MTIPTTTLAGCSCLRCLTPGAVDALAEFARQDSFVPGDRLIRAGEPPHRLLILTRGLAKMVGVPEHGQQRILFLFRPSDMIGPSVLMDGPHTEHDVVAMEHARAVTISRRDLLVIGRSHPSILLALAREVSRQLVTITERIMDATSAQVPVRLSKLLLEFADGNGSPADELVPLEHSLTHDTMARIIGASRPHTSATLRYLEECDAVLRQSRNGLLVRPSRLRMIVEDGALDDPAFAASGPRA